jgi:hypothetical protein
MEIVYTDNSIEKQLNYNIISNNNQFIVLIKDLNTENIINSNAFEGSLDQCIEFITNNINN